MNKQKIIDEVLEEVRKKLDDAYNDNIELEPTDVLLINKDLDTIAYPIELFETGTLLNCDGWEAFLIVNDKLERRWVTLSGQQYSDGQFADLLRHNGAKVVVIHGGM